MYSITNGSSNPAKEYLVNDLEQRFFEELSSKLSAQENSKIHLIRMSDGTLSVQYCGCPVGKIKLQGRKHRMQVLKNLYDVDSIEGTYDDFIIQIDSWASYIRKYLK